MIIGIFNEFLRDHNYKTKLAGEEYSYFIYDAIQSGIKLGDSVLKHVIFSGK